MPLTGSYMINGRSKRGRESFCSKRHGRPFIVEKKVETGTGWFFGDLMNHADRRPGTEDWAIILKRGGS